MPVMRLDYVKRRLSLIGIALLLVTVVIWQYQKSIERVRECKLKAALEMMHAAMDQYRFVPQ
jgi:type II secretory pathway pseudopilin PulG